MKLIVTGATGFVGKEVIRQATLHPAITSVVALARSPTPAPSSNASKFTALVCEDFAQYSDATKAEFTSADACIWLLAVTPSKSRGMTWEEIRKVCHGYTAAGLDCLSAPASQPRRIVYMSGSNAQRDPAKKPFVLGDFCLLRGEVETLVLDRASSSASLEGCVLKPGLIRGPGRDGLMASVGQALLGTVAGVPTLNLADAAAAALDLAVNGFEKDTYSNEDMVRIGQEARRGFENK